MSPLSKNRPFLTFLAFIIHFQPKERQKQAQSAGAVEYTDCISVEAGKIPLTTSVLDGRAPALDIY